MQRSIDTVKQEYDYLSRLWGYDKNMSFMNHGYSPINDSLKSSDILLKQCAMLYYKTTEGLDNCSGKSLLEIGCGRGGGLNYIKKTYPNH